MSNERIVKLNGIWFFQSWQGNYWKNTGASGLTRRQALQAEFTRRAENAAQNAITRLEGYRQVAG